MTQDVPYVEIDAVMLGDDAACNLFAAMVREVFDVEPLDLELVDGVSVAAWHLGTTMIGTFTGPALRFIRDPARVASSGLDQILIQLYTDGGFEGVAGDAAIIVATGDICVFDLGDTISTRTQAFANISMLVPRDALRDGIDDMAVLHGLVVGGTTPLGAILGDHLRSLVRHIPSLRAGDVAYASGATLSLIVATLVASTRGRTRSRPVAAHISPLRRACDYIEAHIHDPSLDVERITQALGCSRAALFRLFAREGGVERYIKGRRLAGAALELADPICVRRIGNIAQRWGFSSDTVFSRAFRQAFGVSPRAARGRQPLFPGNYSRREDTVIERRFTGWIRSVRGASAAPDRKSGPP